MVKSHSTRTTLTLYFTGAFGVVVVGLAIGSYLVVRHEVYTELDSALAVAAGAITMSAPHEIAEHTKMADGEKGLQIILDSSPRSSLPDTQLLIRDGERNVAHKATQSPEFDLRDISTARLLRASGNEGLRIASRTMQVPQFNAQYRVYAASSVQPALRKLREFREVLFVCVLFGLSLAAMAGYLVAKRVLAPLSELTETIEAITSFDLSRRVALNRAPGDLAWLASRFNSLLDRLETAFQQQRLFMADASHELRTPLTVALSAVQVTARDLTRSPGDLADTLTLVEEQILHLRTMVDHMLLLSQVDASSLRLEKRPFYLDDAISEASRAARALAGARHQTVRVGELGEAAAFGDENLFKQAVLILLDNAVKYSQPGGEITLNLTQNGDRWRCRVWNNGPAIPPEFQDRIFERFFRGHGDGNEKTSGAGLGLPIARAIAEKLDGTLRLAYSGVEGTAFDVELPVLSPAAAVGLFGPNSLAVKM